MQLHRFGLAWARNLMLFLGIATWLEAAPSNDHFGNSLPIGGAGVVVFGENYDASYDPGEPYHNDEGGSGSVWWHWTAPANGVVEITTAGSDFDTLLAVYVGSTVSTLTEVASSDDDEQSVGVYSRVSFTASAGTTYRIAVDGYATDMGHVVLGVSQGRGPLTWSSMSQASPTMKATVNGSMAQISWARSSWPFTLETKAMGGIWTPMDLSYTLTTSNVFVNAPLQSSSQVFRLRRPPW